MTGQNTGLVKMANILEKYPVGQPLQPTLSILLPRVRSHTLILCLWKEAVTLLSLNDFLAFVRELVVFLLGTNCA